MILKRILSGFFLILLFHFPKGYCQGINFLHLFDSTVKGNKSTNIDMSLSSLLQKASRGNSLNFMEMGSFVNGNNIQFLNTNDVKYLFNSQKLIEKIIANSDSDVRSKGNLWRLKDNGAAKLKAYNNLENALFEGYLFRYVGEFLFLAKKSGHKMEKIPISFLKNNFDKWYDRSLKIHGDASLISNIRLHMGAQWATAAMYIYKLEGGQKYLKFYNDFNSSLKNNLKLRTKGVNKYYVWNSSYDGGNVNTFVKGRRQKGLDKGGEIQDVTHGNHIVQFVIDSYKLGMGRWSLNDLKLFSNTLIYSIWDERNKTFSDNVDGSKNRDKSIVGSGWKQADGWMKLMEFNSKLYPIYLSFYKVNLNKVKTNKSSGNLQFYGNMLTYKRVYGK